MITVVSESQPQKEPVASAPLASEEVTDKESASEATASDKTASESETEESETTGEEEGSKEAEESEEESTEAKEQEDAKPKKGKGGFQRRIDKLNQRYSAVEQEMSYWKNLALKNAGEDSKEAPKVEAKPKASAEGKPDPENFDSHAEYVEALTDWKTEAKFKERAQSEERAKFESDYNKRLDTHRDKVKAFAATVSDFEDVVEAVSEIKVSPTIEDLILTSESGAQLVYELAKDPEMFKRLNALPPIAAARELGRLESKLSSSTSESKQETKKITKAPQPIAPVGAKGGSPDSKSIFDPNLSQKDYERLRAKQLAAKRSA